MTSISGPGGSSNSRLLNIYQKVYEANDLFLRGLFNGSCNQYMLNIAEVVAADRRLMSLSFSLKAAGLEPRLSATGPLTFFAPTEISFGNLHEGELKRWLKSENKAFHNEILSTHVVEGIISFAHFSDGQQLKTINGKELSVSIINSRVYVNGTVVKEQESRAENGIVYPIDKLIAE
ncbi:MAG: fasciclin domain-containing protein [Bacteroidota bacterium]